MHKPILDQEQIQLAVVGAGGLGAPALWGLCEYLFAHLPNIDCKIKLIDHDVVELSNLNRQVFFQEHDIGKSKAHCLKRGLGYCLGQDLNTVEAVNEKLELSNIEKLLGSSHLVLDCTDATETKFLLNDFCVLKNIPLIHAGVSGSTGQVLAILPGRQTPCLRCLFGDFSESDYQEQTTTCRHSGVFGAFAGMIGFIQVKLAIEALQGTISDATTLHRLSYPELIEEEIQVVAAEDCPLGCSFHKRQTLDLTQKKCPDTFLYTKLQLEQMSGHALLDVRLSSKESVDNVSRSVIEEGFALCGKSTRISDNSWSLRIATESKS